jgi:transaldolase
MASAIPLLIEFGQSPWYDNLTRAVATGGLQTLMDTHGIRGVTSNPTIFEKAMASGNDYAAQLHEVTSAGASTEAAYWDLVTTDIEHAADILRPLYDRLGSADGYVSVEVSPDYAHDTAATVRQAKELWERLARPNVMIKIPATVEGIPAITETLAAGINVNVTLIFSLERYQQVIGAFLTGLEQRAAAGGDLRSLASVASFFVSRVDTETDRRLPEGHALRGKAAVANAKLAYELFREKFSGPRWDALAAKGARLQRPLWASTSTKNANYPDLLYVDSLIGPATVNTMPEGTLSAFEDHGTLKRTVDADPDGAAQALARLKDAGIDMRDVEQTLEDEGVHSFAKSFDELLQSLTDKAASF